ncbi:MAG TPA: alpha/beta fold hydrolase, partial [Puia sp.]|nr:alpha/beta fold hydrolase [Puia sp.]
MKQVFTIGINRSVIDDLKNRLAATRWTDEIENDKWQYGTNEKYLKELCDYWRNQFDWYAQQDYLNSFNHYKTEIDGTGIHFIHQKGRGKNPVPLLLIHGFPDSFVRFLKVIPMLTEADKNGLSFDLVIPSIPGYGFSDIPKKPGMDTKEIGVLFNKLMTDELGYKKYLVQ